MAIREPTQVIPDLKTALAEAIPDDAQRAVVLDLIGELAQALIRQTTAEAIKIVRGVLRPGAPPHDL